MLGSVHQIFKGQLNSLSLGVKCSYSGSLFVCKIFFFKWLGLKLARMVWGWPGLKVDTLEGGQVWRWLWGGVPPGRAISAFTFFCLCVTIILISGLWRIYRWTVGLTGDRRWKTANMRHVVSLCFITASHLRRSKCLVIVHQQHNGLIYSSLLKSSDLSLRVKVCRPSVICVSKSGRKVKRCK